MSVIASNIFEAYAQVRKIAAMAEGLPTPASLNASGRAVAAESDEFEGKFATAVTTLREHVGKLNALLDQYANELKAAAESLDEADELSAVEAKALAQATDVASASADEAEALAQAERDRRRAEQEAAMAVPDEGASMRDSIDDS